MLSDVDGAESGAVGYRERVEGFPLPPSLGALLDRAADTYGAESAWVHVESDEDDITYAALRERVAAAAEGFRRLGIRKGTHVAVMLPNVPESLVSWLAIARLGAVMVPMNPGYTYSEIEYVITDSDAGYLVTTPELARTVTGGADGARAVLVPAERTVVVGGELPGAKTWGEIAAATPAAGQDGPEGETVGLDDVVNIQYTSGSTGFPKGCLLTHRYWLQMGAVIAGRGNTFRRVQCDLPFYYMGPLWRFCFAALQGAALCVPPRFSLSRMIQRIHDYDMDHGSMGDLEALLPESPLDKTTRLREIAVFGIRRDLQPKLEQKFGVPSRELYGMTEIGWGVCMPLEDQSMSGSGSCGVPAPFRACRIVDENGNDLGPGEIGELWVSGAGIMRGYYKKPEATEKAFVGEWFRTGDLFVRDEGGYFYFKGRIKETIRRSSENISPTEVEHAIGLLEGIHEVVVVGVEDEVRGEEVKACIVLSRNVSASEVTPQIIRDHARRHLARFKLPRFIQYFESFPRTGSDKVDRKLLARGEVPALGETFDLEATAAQGR